VEDAETDLADDVLLVPAMDPGKILTWTAPFEMRSQAAAVFSTALSQGDRSGAMLAILMTIGAPDGAGPAGRAGEAADGAAPAGGTGAAAKAPLTRTVARTVARTAKGVLIMGIPAR